MLYIVATPIGNLSEITYRAVEVLSNVDYIAAEDTRHTAILLNRYEIKKPMLSYHKFTENGVSEKIIELLESGKNIALVSDAGMPLISDPGGVLIGKLIERNLQYTVISGACALINAVLLSGLDASSFLMAGFLPDKQSDRQKFIDKFKDVQSTLIFYTPPHSVMKDLQFLYEVLGARSAAVVREISKIHEQTVRFTLGEVPTFTLKGEMVIVVEKAAKQTEDFSSLTIEQHVLRHMQTGLSKMDAIKKTALDRGLPKSAVYNASLNIPS